MSYLLNLYRNNFSSLVISKSCELAYFKLWSTLYNEQLFLQRPLFTLHDGPPYANGNIHLGHALNKILKDTILRKKLISGFRVWYLPGWDCFGLPIEINVGIGCSYCSYYRYVSRQITLQRLSFIQLGCFYDWSMFYRTMDLVCVFRELNAFYLLVNFGNVFVVKSNVDYCSLCCSAVSHYETESQSHNVRLQMFCIVCSKFGYVLCIKLFKCIYLYFVRCALLLRLDFLPYLLASIGCGFYLSVLVLKRLCCRHKSLLIVSRCYQVFLDTAVNEVHFYALQQLRFFPGTMFYRFYKSVFSRPYWCISRQRYWGVPVLLWYYKSLVLINSFKVLVLLARYGYRAWRRLSLASTYKCFTKCCDVLDVWFDSGLTHYSVCLGRKFITLPVDLCVEGNDQYRGWFNSSYLTSVLLYFTPPFKALLTHGFVVDRFSRKLSKSLGNYLLPINIINKYSLEVFRFTVITSDYFSNLTFYDGYFTSKAVLRSKILNVVGFLVVNVQDYPVSFFPVKLSPLDLYILFVFSQLKVAIQKLDAQYMYYKSFEVLSGFIFGALSGDYIVNIKYCLYVLSKYSVVRLTCQFVLYFLLREILLLLAPYLCFSVENIWSLYFNGSVFEHQFTTLPFVCSYSYRLIVNILTIKRLYYSSIVSFKGCCRLVIFTFDTVLKRYSNYLSFLFHVFKVSVYFGGLRVHILPCYGLFKCCRCWNYVVRFIYYKLCSVCFLILLGVCVEFVVNNACYSVC